MPISERAPQRRPPQQQPVCRCDAALPGHPTRNPKGERRSHRLSAEGSATTTPAGAERRLRPPNHATTDPEGGEPERGIPQKYS